MTQPLPPDALLGDRVLEGVTRIDMSAFERAVRGTPPAGFPVLLTPPQGVAVLDVDVDTWAGTLLPREAEPFPVQAAAPALVGEHFRLDQVAELVAPVEPVGMFEPVAVLEPVAMFEPVAAPAALAAPAAPAAPAASPAGRAAPPGRVAPSLRRRAVAKAAVALGIGTSVATAMGAAILIATVVTPPQAPTPGSSAVQPGVVQP